MNIRKLAALILALAMALSLAACGNTANKPAETPTDGSASADTSAEASTPVEEEAAPAIPVGTQVPVVMGFDWGPAVTKTILSLAQSVTADSVSAEDFAVVETKESFDWATMGPDHVTADAPRTVTAAYTCDASGERVEGASSYVALEMSYDPNIGAPFCFDLFTWMNTWCNPYELAVSLNEGASLTAEDGSEVTELGVDASTSWDNALMPQMDAFDLTGVFTGTDGKTLRYASYTPADAGADNKKPLVIWLHGAGEGGENPTLALLGNEVSVLAGEEFQNIMGGAYILTPQTPSFWLTYNEEGDWQGNPGVDSVFRPTLMELIEGFVAENPGVDTDRIIIGGCSNGGYMTMDMVLNYPDYFAAAYPICEAYQDSGITDEQLEGIKDLPIWFIYAKNDDTVVPADFEIPTLERLTAISSNVHTSIYDDVHDTSGTYTDENGAPYQYMGHWSWLYFFNNECVDENGVNMWSWMAEQSK